MPKQSVNQVTVKTGGKLYIAGEYSVLTPGQTALIQFIPIFMSAELREASRTQLSSDMFDYSVGREPDANYALIQEALNTFEVYCGEKLPSLDLSITGKLERDGVKFGIGSSGSVVVLTLKALAAALQKDLSKAEQGLDAIAKSSGAGGGDCGIAFAFDQASRDILVKRWQQAGIELLYEV